MTQEQRTSKNFFRLNGGLNTEINELNFPDGVTRDEANYELLVDGSRKRRKGLAVESGAGSAKTVATVELTSACNSYTWTNVDGDPDLNFIVTQVGERLYFAVDQETPSTSWKTSSISLIDFSTTGTLADSRTNKVSLSSGRGHLFVSGPFSFPFYVSYSAATGEVTAKLISIVYRDYEGVDDGTSIATEPTGTITDTHRYNLRNRGWGETDMATVLSDLTKHPSRRSVYYQGYVRTSDTTLGAGAINPEDGVKAWGASSAKFDAEHWGASSAPQGSLFLNPFDTTFTVGSGGVNPIAISNWVVADETVNPWVVTVTATGHGMTHPAQVTITNNDFVYDYTTGEGDGTTAYRLDGTYNTVSTADANTFVFNFPYGAASTFDNWVDQYENKGQIGEAGVTPLAKPDGIVITDGFRAIEFHEGRIFYAGMGHKDFADTIFFSKLVLTPLNYGQCHQVADPTDEHFNALTAADGGFAVIPGMGKVLNMVSQRNSLVIFATAGIWEISGGSRGAFTADAYSVRKITAIGASSLSSCITVEGGLVYTGPAGLNLIAPAEFTGRLESTSASQQTIQTLWNEIPIAQQERVHAIYDESLRRVYFMFGADAASNLHTTMLIFDANSGGFYKYTFNTATDLGLIGAFAISNANDTATNKKIKFIYQATPTTIQIADFVQTSFNDFNGANGPLPFLIFGHDNLNEFQRRKQAPVITVFSKRTETGYVDNGTGWDPTNESSTLMSARWDWTDDAVTNKIGAKQEVYRHARQFVPSGANDVDGYPVVVTRNKVRGRGRSLQLRFDGATDKDSHVLGFATNYKVTRKV